MGGKKELSAGDHVMHISGRFEGVKIDAFSIYEEGKPRCTEEEVVHTQPLTVKPEHTPKVFFKNNQLTVKGMGNANTALVSLYDIKGNVISTFASCSGGCRLKLQRGVFLIRIKTPLKHFVQTITVIE